MAQIVPALLVVAGCLVLWVPPAAAAPQSSAGISDFERCLLEGDIVEQPPGSTIAACCIEGEGCLICEADFSDCEWDPAYVQSPRPLLDKSRPAIAPKLQSR